MESKYVNKVSIIVLAYKNYWNLTECMDSIVCQTYKNIEIIFADDGTQGISENEIQDKIERILANKYKTIYKFSLQNQGTVKNFNNAIRNSSGDLIVPLSLDDCLGDKYVIERIVKYFNDNHSLMATSYSCQIKESKYRVSPSEKELNYLQDNKKAIKELLTLGLFFKGANTYYHKNVFKRYGLFDENYKLYEDVPFLLNYLEKGEKVGVIPYICVLYSMKGQGVSSKKNVHKSLVEDRKYLYNKILQNSSYSGIHRWIKYNLYRNLYPNKDIEAIFKFPDIIIRKALKKYLRKEKWMDYGDAKEIEEIVVTQNKRLQKTS